MNTQQAGFDWVRLLSERPARTSMVLALAGTSLAVLLALAFLSHERVRVDLDFAASADSVARDLEGAWTTELAAIEHLATVFRTSELVTRREFALASDILRARHPSLQSLHWAPKVALEARPRFIAAEREVNPDFDLVEFDANGERRAVLGQGVSFPILYIEPLSGNRRALGALPGAATPLQQAFDRAIGAGGLVVTADVPLPLAKAGAVSLLAAKPVYKHTAAALAPIQASRGVAGLVSGLYRVDRLVEGALAQTALPGIETTVYMNTDAGQLALHRSPPKAGETPAWYLRGAPPPAGHDWRLGGRGFRAVVSARGPDYAYDLRPALAVLLLALLLTGSGVGTLALLMQRERASRALADQHRQTMRHQATYDALTGLVNRAAFEQRLEQALLEVGGASKPLSLCFLDLDEFKAVNDLHGYHAGDDLLRGVAAHLAERLRPGDVLARLGGDEFAVLLPVTAAAEAHTLAKSYLHGINDYRLRLEQRTVAVGVSIGIAEILDAATPVATALAEVDTACHIAKEQGRNRIHLFGRGDAATDLYRSQMRWASEVRQALDENRLELHGQRILPTNPAGKGHTMREILIRMRDRDGGLVSPGDFIPAAERYNLMGELDRWVIDKALALKARLGDTEEIWSINLSGQSIGRQDLFGHIHSRLGDGGPAPGEICFEITETAAVRSLANASRFVKRLRRIGCLVALDDFGSGMSSFVYLKHLPVDFLKIDGGFVTNIEHSPMDRAMVRAIRQIARELGIRTIAEYVESAASLEAVRRLGIDFVQGFYTGRPAPILDRDRVPLPYVAGFD